MHIPDGYLSPSTCVALYAGAAPFWYVALRRLKRWLSTRLIPLLSVFAAFSFLVMMFNLPLPGGTTGHALGVAIAAIVLGPWASILALSIALLIQALFFGDGGVTTLGANCFNMAIVGSLVSYLVYRLLAGRAAITSSRRVVAAALAGYTAINASAFCAALEFGIQPLLFRDPRGAPLYAPYPLSIAIPAMMIGHLTFAGLAELVLSGGVVAYFQRAIPSLLELTAPGAGRGDQEHRPVVGQGAWHTLRPLWTALALLLALTPLGVLAGGAAWGEWGVRDFSQAAARRQIAAASSNLAPPSQAPQGLERLSSVWTAPFPQYAPSFVRRPALGYMLSAMFGSGIILLVFMTASAIFAHRRPAAAKKSKFSVFSEPPKPHHGEHQGSQ
ncbi:MAG TPA: cobalt transporter CbiM [Terriglobia bacterium]|nr:cobalt transporter CbiM [Terriglobia bacterium]